MTIRLCVVIPVYNHGPSIERIAPDLDRLDLPVILVNDGSRRETTTILDKAVADQKQLSVKHRDRNGGKGAALCTGLREAHARGFTHALQIDADGQHTLADVPLFAEAAGENPEALILGYAQYDESVPRLRYYGRYLTHLLVWLECLSTAARDTMCGFRVYPLGRTLAVIDRSRIGMRMEFDTEIVVRLHWSGVRIVNRGTSVIYPTDGLSHFRMVKDNARISWMHTRMVIGMLLRVPKLLLRRR